MREIDEDELHHYQLIMLYKLLKDKGWSNADIDYYERDYAQKLVTLRELRSQITRESVVDKMSGQMPEDKDQAMLFSILLNDEKLKLKKLRSIGEDTTPGSNTKKQR